ncbi:hypothetical protein RHGRI_020911 [Rhododendron griersonianum]|uniref:Uncharacterized protein n=1 Tax=Rhododendron griersonianum TaxID=479676 RepID=A0AAV6JI11_9ERIC|nr:hypothetical protein RHGRI_020911 [Rhododendron griersonianum]
MERERGIWQTFASAKQYSKSGKRIEPIKVKVGVYHQPNPPPSEHFLPIPNHPLPVIPRRGGRLLENQSGYRNLTTLLELPQSSESADQERPESLIAATANHSRGYGSPQKWVEGGESTTVRDR